MNADYLRDAAIAMREALITAPIPSLLLPAAIDDADAAALRARLDAAGTTPFWIADRGRYACNATLVDAPLWDALIGFASGAVDRPLRVIGARWLRFGRGDYALVKDDARTRPAGPHVELVLDLSATASGEAEIVYGDGAAIVSVPQVPTLLSLVDRGPTSTRYERPPTVRGGGGEIVRLRLWLTT